MISAQEALARLREGNRRFVAGAASREPALDEERRLALARWQQPFAVILGCSDSRVPTELVFGQGFGDLFVIRVAGNIVAPTQVGSVEFAATRFGTRLVVVLGHTGCGAVTATVEGLKRPAPSQSPGLREIVERLRPVVEPLLATPLGRQTDGLIAEAVRANIRAAVNELRRGSDVLRPLAERGELAVVGAEYDLRTGVVDFFCGDL
ncbi:MAG TPA: carbonic anhydrase [Gemmatimonadales bacterium]|nr:carbonic anhydrase [Gemmatimonadales bacterium]